MDKKLVYPFLFLTLAAAASPAKPPETWNATAQGAALSAIERAIQKDYVFPELKAPLVGRLEEGRKTGRYDTAEPDLFAQRVTEDMQTVAHDGHLYLDYDKAGYAAHIAPPKSDQGIVAYRQQLALREDSGIRELRILPGNLRYMKLTAFRWAPGLSAKAYDGAARFLRGGDAIILDLRENGGGNSDAADYFEKALVRPNKGKPIYVLVDGHVASAAEAVAYGLQQEKAAVVVGSTTYGAANNNKKIPIAPGFVLSVSYHRPINPISKTNWEGTGVVPDIAVAGSKALETAEWDALSKLASAPGATQERLNEYKWAQAGVQAQLHPMAPSHEQLVKYAGRYGPVDIRLASDGLRMSRHDRPRWEQDVLLVPMTPDGLFSVQSFDDLRLRVHDASLDLLHGAEDARESFQRDAGQQG
jgi:hypothetical protein